MVLKELSQNKRQVSLVLLEQGMRRLQDNVKNINEDYFGDSDLRTLLTNLVENLHVVSHCFVVCPRLWHDFEGIFKKDNGVGSQILHKREIVLSGSDVNVMKPSPVVSIVPQIETAMKEFVDRYRSSCQAKNRTQRNHENQSRISTLTSIFQSTFCTKVIFHEDAQDYSMTENGEGIE